MHLKRYLLSLVGLLLSGIFLKAQLINFDLTFTDDNPQPYADEVDGTVTGEIIGLQNNATSLPEEVIITSAPGGLKIPTPLTLFSGVSTSGAITVSNDEITGSTYVFNGGGYLFAIGFTDQEPTQLGNTATTDAYTLSRAGEEYIYAGQTEAPEPSTWALVLGGLGLLAFVPQRLRRGLMGHGGN